MDVFFAWAHSDPYYHAVVPHCGMLVSVPNVSSVWTVRRFPNLPARLMIDSGGYQALKGETPSVRSTFLRQVEMAAGVPGTLFCALDAPLPKGGLAPRERYARVERTIANAYAYKALAAELSPALPGQLLAIIQGDDLASIRYCAEELARIGFARYGLGSLAMLYNPQEIVRRVTAALDIVGPNLHVFGVSATSTMRELAHMGVGSVDTARPMHAAVYNVVFYSQPFRRYGILGTQYQRGNAKFSRDRELSSPLPCDCPPCREQPSRLLAPRGQAAIHHRALHNGYHLAREVASLSGGRSE